MAEIPRESASASVCVMLKLVLAWLSAYDSLTPRVMSGGGCSSALIPNRVNPK